MEKVSGASNSEFDSAGSGPEYNGNRSSSESESNKNRQRPKKSSAKRKQEINTLKRVWERYYVFFFIKKSFGYFLMHSHMYPLHDYFNI